MTRPTPGMHLHVCDYIEVWDTPTDAMWNFLLSCHAAGNMAISQPQQQQQKQFLIQDDHLPPLIFTDNNNNDNSAKLWLLVVFVLASFGMIGYVLYLVQEKERKEQKNK